MTTAAVLTGLTLLLAGPRRLAALAAHPVGRSLLRLLIGFHLASAALALRDGVLGQVLVSVASVCLALRLLVLDGRRRGGGGGGGGRGGGGGGGGGGRGPQPPSGPWSGRERRRPQRSGHGSGPRVRRGARRPGGVRRG
ncbi:MAG: hypothetical protein JWN17_2911 [Frankiales bacterium]|nr:hypothetical protein [Frankiales bacterium]